MIALLASCGSTGSYYNGAYTGSSSSKPKDISNACNILQEKPHWVAPLRSASRQYNSSMDTILAIIYQESSFNATARPRINPATNKPMSSAYGYAQALNGTWKHYQQQTGKRHYRRDVFAHATDFIGWYIDISYRKNKVSRNRADLIYLTYHEGWGGYAKKTHKRKPWLIQTAAKVAARQKRFKRQLASCPGVLQGNGVYYTHNQQQSPKNTNSGAVHGAQKIIKYHTGWF